MKREFLNDFFRKKWQNKDIFSEIFKLEGETFRDVKNRHTMRIELDGKGFFVKIHRGVGWREILKNLTQFKMPILGAANEYDALNQLHKLNIDTMTPAAFALRGKNPAKLESFLITEELTEVESLEDICKRWHDSPPSWPEKYAIIKKLANTTHSMIESGINHRDYYICHFLMDLKNSKPDNPILYLIDLHRAGLRNKVPYRYQIKDIGGLFFSAMDVNLTKQDFYRFMIFYSGKSLRQTLAENRKFWLDVKNNGIKLYKKDFKHNPSQMILDL